jgi:hypothetical protein
MNEDSYTLNIELQKLEDIHYIDDDISGNPCPICLDKLNIIDKIMISNGCECTCLYHDKCFLEWYLKNKTCPICRKNIPIQSINSFMYNTENESWKTFDITYGENIYEMNINEEKRLNVFMKYFFCIALCSLCSIGSILLLIYFLRKYYEAPIIY